MTGHIGSEYYLDASEKVEMLVPKVASLNVINGWSDIQFYTPDGCVILGRTELKGIRLACGMSDDGVQQSPAINIAAADLIVKGETDVPDIGYLSIGRF